MGFIEKVRGTDPTHDNSGEVRKTMRYLRVLVAAPLFSMLLLTGPTASAGPHMGLSFNVNLGAPVVVAEPPDMVLIPGMSVYFVPGGDVDVFFYGGYWWEPVGPKWYRSRSLDGHWVAVSPRSVPGPLYRVPADYRARYARGKHIPYGQWKKGHRGHWDEGRSRKHEGRQSGDRGHGHGRGND